MGEVPKQLLPFIFKKGWKGGGRKPGKSMKEYSRSYLAKMSEEERIEFLNSIDPDLIWRMAEGNPHTTEDITSGNKPLATPIYGGLSIPKNNSNRKTIRNKKKDS